MIYIEVIFGAINGNALDVDSALSLTSTNPVQNKVIAEELDLLQRNIDDAVAGLHAFTIDFQDTREIVQMHTFVVQELTHIKTSNVSTLSLSINGSPQYPIPLTDGEWTGKITVASGALLVWQIGRTSEGSIAEISVQYQYNS